MKWFTVTVSAFALLGAAALVARSETQSRTVYFSVLDKKGAPVTDLSAAEVVIKEDGRIVTAIKIGPATTPMRIALVVDDRGLGLPELREGLTTFVRAIQGRADVGLFSTIRPATTIVDFTQDTQALLAGVEQVLPMQLPAAPATLPSGLTLTPLLSELAHQMEKHAVARPVIVVMTIEPDCRDTQASFAIQGNCVSYFIAGPVSVMSGIPNTSDPRFGTGFERQADYFDAGASARWPQVITDVQRSRATVFSIAARDRSHSHPLLDGSADVSGGHLESVITDAAIVTAMNHIADELLGQYAVTYSAPPAPQEGRRLHVQVKRSDIIVRAPQRVGVR